MSAAPNTNSSNAANASLPCAICTLRDVLGDTTLARLQETGDKKPTSCSIKSHHSGKNPTTSMMSPYFEEENSKNIKALLQWFGFDNQVIGSICALLEN